MKTRFLTMAAIACLAGCDSSKSDDSSAAGAHGGESGQGGDVSQGGQGGEGGLGGGQARSVLVEVDIPAGSDADQVVVLIADAAGNVSSTFLGSELPVEAPVKDGDLVWYLFEATSFSEAATYRVTPELTRVKTRGWLPSPDETCELGAPMTLLIDVPEVEGCDVFELGLVGASYVPMSSLEPGINEVQVTACAGTETFGVLMLARESSRNFAFPSAFGRIDSIPYAPGSTSSMPITFSQERDLSDVVVMGEPGTVFGINGTWSGAAFDNDEIVNELVQTLDESGVYTAAHGPFALGAGKAGISVTSPPIGWTCELDYGWKEAPFDDAPLIVKFGGLAGLAPAEDGNVALEAGGEIGDAMLRTQASWFSDDPAVWTLHEDPNTSYPLPVRPAVPEELPGFRWPNGGAEVRYIHLDDEALSGYAEYAQSHRDDMSGRARHRIPAECF